MTQNGKEMRNVMTRIGLSMLFFLLAQELLYGGALLLKMFITESLFPYNAKAYILSDLLVSIAYVAIFLLPAGFFYLISKGKSVRHVLLEPHVPEEHTLLKVLTVIFLGCGVILVMSYLNSFFTLGSSETEQALFFDSLDSPYKLILMFLSTAIVPGFVEEMLFRGVVLTNIAPYGKVSAVVISSLLFGLMHQNPEQMLYATAAGVVLGTVYLLTGSLWCSILLHLFNNFFAILNEYMYMVFSSGTAYSVNLIFDCFVFLVGIILGGFYLFLRNKEGQSKERALDVDEKRVDAKEAVRAFLNPAMIFFVCFCILMMIIVLL